jgi:hypothetical protein
LFNRISCFEELTFVKFTTFEYKTKNLTNETLCKSVGHFSLWRSRLKKDVRPQGAKEPGQVVEGSSVNSTQFDYVSLTLCDGTATLLFAMCVRGAPWIEVAHYMQRTGALLNGHSVNIS